MVVDSFVLGGGAAGCEGGIIVKLADRYRPAVVLAFRAYVDKNPYKEIKFRLNFYALKRGLSDQSIPQESIIWLIPVSQRSS